MKAEIELQAQLSVMAVVLLALVDASPKKEAIVARIKETSEKGGAALSESLLPMELGERMRTRFEHYLLEFLASLDDAP